MADDSPSKEKLVPAVLELIALALVLGAEESWRADKSWRWWVSEGIAGLLCQVGVFIWSRIASLVRKLGPWEELRQAHARIDELSRLVGPPSKLRIHSALYGVGNAKDVDITESLQAMVPKDALAVTIDNNLIPGIADPAPSQPKVLRVSYSYGSHKNLQFSRPERALLVLPRDIELIQETASEYDRERERQVKVLEKLIESERHTSARNAEQIGQYIRELQRLEGENIKLAAQVNSTTPLIAPISYGALDRPVGSTVGPSSNGLMLFNDGKSAAYDISVPAFTIGVWNINFAPIWRLGVGESTPSSLWTRHNHQSSDDIMGPIIMTQQANGTLGNPIPFTIIFRNAEDNWFSSLCEFKFNPSGSRDALEVRFVRREPFVP